MPYETYVAVSSEEELVKHGETLEDRVAKWRVRLGIIIPKVTFMFIYLNLTIFAASGVMRTKDHEPTKRTDGFLRESAWLLPPLFVACLVGFFFDGDVKKHICAKRLLIIPFNVLLILIMILLTMCDIKQPDELPFCFTDPMTNKTSVNLSNFQEHHGSFFDCAADLLTAHLRCDVLPYRVSVIISQNPKHFVDYVAKYFEVLLTALFFMAQLMMQSFLNKMRRAEPNVKETGFICLIIFPIVSFIIFTFMFSRKLEDLKYCV
uniref:Uncharacterized protein n=1 Tax=Plectus sambesii TaxID=2011161 RepID=A0A914WDD8_9BILA